MSQAPPRAVRSLKARLLLPLLLLGVIGAVAVVWRVHATMMDALQRQVRHRAELAASAVNYAAESITSPGEFERVVTALGAETDIELIVVVGGRPARVLASTRMAWLGQPVTALPADLAADLERAVASRRGEGHRHEATRYDFTEPLLLARPDLADRSLAEGAVTVRLDVVGAETATKRRSIELALTFVAALSALAALGYGLLRSLVLQPLARMGTLVEHHRTSAPEGWVEVAADDELGALAHAFRDSLARTDAAIAELKEREAALRVAEARYRFLFEQAPDGVVIIDPETGRFLEFNTAAHRQLGYSREAFAELTIADVEAVEDRAQVAEHIARIARNGRHDFETRQRTRHGEIRDVLVTAQLADLEGSPIFHGIVRDITERKQAEAKREQLEEELRAARKLESIGSLAGGVAHDFNNLLSVILSYTEFALDAVPEGNPIKDDLAEVKKAGERAATLTRQLLAFSRKQLLRPVPLNLNEVVAAIDKMLGRVIGENIELVQKLAPELGLALVDPSQLDQVIMNLVINARDAMPEGGKLTLETARVDVGEQEGERPMGVGPGRYVRLSVTDTGCGMNEPTRSRVFEPFFTTKEKGKGTGLGLSTVYGIVKQSGGGISVRSAPGKGATFEVLLPCAPDAARAPFKAPSAAPKRGSETILLVEDERPLLEVAKRILVEAGYTVLTAANGPEALRNHGPQLDRIQLLITDVIMPGMNGRALAQELSKTRPDLQVLYMSGYTADVIGHHGVLETGVHFISKPFTAAALTRKVRDILYGKDAAQA